MPDSYIFNIGVFSMNRFEKRITIIRNTRAKSPNDFVGVPFSAIIDRIKTGSKGLDGMSAKGQELKPGDPEAYRRWKATALPAMIPAGVWDQLVEHKDTGEMVATHSYGGWSGTHTGFITMDFDNIEDVDVLKGKLTALPYVFFCFVSPSGKGIKPFIEVDPIPKDRDEHKVAWDALKGAMEAATGAEITVDKQCKNINRLCYLAHDANAYANEDAETFHWELPTAEPELPKAKPKPTEAPPTEAEARELLRYIPNTCEYEDWRNIGMAIKDAGLPVSVFREWSGGQRRASSGEWVSEDIDAHWSRYNGTGISWGTVVHRAIEGGYKARFKTSKSESTEEPKKAKINPILYAEAFMEDDRYWYTQEALHQYNKNTGIYEPCEPQLRRQSRGVLGYDSNTNRINEIVNHISDMSIDGETKKGVAFENGVLDLDTFELSPHSPDNYLLQHFPVKWDRNAQSPRFDAWIQQILPDGECQKAIFEMIGSFFDVDSNFFQTAFLLTGAGSNGKSLLLDIISTLVGEQNICRTPFAKYGKDRFSVSTLVNKTAAIDDDIQPEEPLSSTIKPLITARSLQCEPKYQDAFNFNLQATFVGAINGAPSTTDTTSAFWRRWCVIPFTETFEKNARFAKDLIQAVSTPESRSGLLTTSLSLYKAVLDKGEFTVPKVSEDTVDTMRIDANPVRLFVEDNMIFDADGFETRNDLYDAYVDWCAGRREKEYGRKRFYASLREYGSKGVVEDKRRHGEKTERGFVGLRLI